ncbi:Appr-1-p processing domain protein [Geobacillus thermoleovorans CCB_US3_UF5]|uniref:Appr-1-p processing protein n=2 Tax=Geobacillus thermoleovorans group TaxID=1505648 RepID=U2X4E2_GEOKU|nr:MULTISPECIES: macro domain-containing protein [Geobacillus]AEV20795.1 Appr-1-p processing domain protein [Geobacillus thermoleovorans CCB_US3_UF5]AOL35779.1 Appr-1-p processing protein [Geobacillus thermoleovorans]QDY74641.1 macro domain-containing protein [Geobacillus thermoleovorans]WMJ19730.1 macro domain-containing protein [Geobacillus kaustophilus]GAD13695.1 appr-1-p processing protein [Geobacillus kaustophilus GBlys]
MIIQKKGNLLEDESEALVNTVNCVGVMGKGIALQFKQAYPEMFSEYEKACRRGEVQIGKMHVFSTGTLLPPKYIINFPTKRHWRHRSRLEDIEQGLADLVNVVKELNIHSIALPPLGCGNGGLRWEVVRPKIEAAFASLQDVTVHLYEPAGSPQPDRMNIRTSRPRMTRARALLLLLMNDYLLPGYHLSLLEVQKLAYFLQEVGEPLKLRFVKGEYGPYADNLNHVLLRINGHFLSGVGDRSGRAEIRVLPHAVQEAEEQLHEDVEAKNHLKRVRMIIRGFETPYGLELLATVHWVVKEHPHIKNDLDAVADAVGSWNERKRKLFPKRHIAKALTHLCQVCAFD